MNKEQIRDKNIVMDFSVEEYGILTACVGLAVEAFVPGGTQDGFESYGCMLKFKYKKLEEFGWRVCSTALTAMTMKKEV